ncbi:uncharacterized protein BKA78DRAFT_32292 [Phyllosticta capitalensis]|uniref:uncharacterized protein n=1 Tax=Phyllosticta capitalensis TaxID=121624 RepID=UPI00312DBA04
MSVRIHDTCLHRNAACPHARSLLASPQRQTSSAWQGSKRKTRATRAGRGAPTDWVRQRHHLGKQTSHKPRCLGAEHTYLASIRSEFSRPLVVWCGSSVNFYGAAANDPHRTRGDPTRGFDLARIKGASDGEGTGREGRVVDVFFHHAGT